MKYSGPQHAERCLRESGLNTATHIDVYKGSAVSPSHRRNTHLVLTSVVQMGVLGQNSSLTCPSPSSSFPEVAAATWTRLRPVAATVQNDLQSMFGPILEHLQPHVQRATEWADTQLDYLHPWQIALLAVGSTWVALTCYRWLTDLAADVRDVGESPHHTRHKHTVCGPVLSSNL